MEQEEISGGQRKLEVKEEPKFKIGDKVQVLRKAERSEMDPDISWPIGKDASIGEVGVVTAVQLESKPIMYKLKFDKGTNYGWRFPACVLKKMSKWKLKQIEKQTK